ncbi:hypothetical protein AB0M46_27875 [Dactylosporangium sp. NPDC051485]|uniref:hypothetical protein n=1 Tax=Dactylosporangium sp. NPDC051485 TaxID=3154846 RepID=UPI00342BEF32
MNRIQERVTTAAISAVATFVVVSAGSVPASASPWDPHVHVVGSVSSCGPSSTSGWGWFDADNGESDWLTWGAGSTFGFDLNRVPAGSSTQVTIKWGVAGCTASARRGVSRPLIGSNAAIGNLG